MNAVNEGLSDSIGVRTTERGLPISVKLTQRALMAPPEQLAKEILRRCQQMAGEMRSSRRRELTARGFDADVIEPLCLDDAAEAGHPAPTPAALEDPSSGGLTAL